MFWTPIYVCFIWLSYQFYEVSILKHILKYVWIMVWKDQETCPWSQNKCGENGFQSVEWVSLCWISNGLEWQGKSHVKSTNSQTKWIFFKNLKWLMALTCKEIKSTGRKISRAEEILTKNSEYLNHLALLTL